MRFEEIQNIFQTPWLSPWQHDYYAATFLEPKTSQEFLDYAYSKIENLSGIWYEVAGPMAYFVVAKGTIIPEDFAYALAQAEDVPEQPVIEEGTE
jgi:hypothetical protein